MDPEKGISIITPFYNQTEIFWETYNAVINQTYINWEWIIVNDGSNDQSSVETLARLKNLNNERIKIISFPDNLGLPAARNKGVQESFFNYLFFLDSDDLIESDYLEKAWITLLLNPGFAFVDSWSTGFGAKNYLWQAGLDKKEKFLKQNWVAFAGLFQKKIFSHLQFNTERINGLEDWEFWLQAAALGYWGFTIPEYLFHYRIHDIDHHRWQNWDNSIEQKKVTRQFHARYSKLLSHHFPDPQKGVYQSLPEQNDLTGITSPSIKKNTILIVLPWLELGGVERFTLHYMAAMAPVYDFIIVTTNAGAHKHQAEFKKYCRQIYHFAGMADSTAYPVLWNYVINTWKIHLLVLSHSLPAYYILAYLREAHSSLAIIDIMHLVEESWKDGGYPNIAIDYSAYIDKHVVASNQIHRWMASRGINADKLQTIYINVDTKNITPLDEDLRQQKRKSFYNLKSADQLVLLFSGRLTAQKNTLLLPDIAFNLASKGINFLLAIAGEGPEKELLEEKIFQKKLQHYFTFLGTLSYSDNIEAIKLADILFLPSAWEGIATVLFEAMAAGTPVVATNVGGQQELIEPGTGIIIPLSANNDQLVETIASNLQNLMQDAALRKSMGDAARKQVVQYFDISITHHKLQTLFNECLARNNTLTDSMLPSYEIIQNYFKNISSWKQEQLLPSPPKWKQRATIKLIKRIYKVLTRKRPLNYIWSKGRKSIG